jgi:type I restriction enzyme, S subunit
VSSDGFIAKLKGLTGGTSTSHQRATPRDVMSIGIPVPADTLIAKFNDAVLPMLKLANCLRWQIANLRTQRDLLLPKLISSEIDVSAAPAALTEAAE